MNILSVSFNFSTNSLRYAVTVEVITSDGRVIVGTFKGFDQTTNVILSSCHERVFSETEGVETLPLGLYIIRGDNIVLIGEIDLERDASVDLTEIRAAPITDITRR
ncbi:U6 snRNA-associated Sm-like protein LSm8 [Gigaspora margarita]|uniref:LSM2-LSM8 complex subunit LSM8 n=2 Tax=Gigaspora margarita TaxID=4874 RepID=A0A8H4A1K3_GIGMA|nr:U6 snRNA-associated Sm-like protein LSm8 [Gigaspora margarita]